MKTNGKNNIKETAIDLPETSDDKKHLQPEVAVFDLPEVKDIPGQEHIIPMPFGEMADTTISSADEEAEDLLSADEDNIVEQYNSNVTGDERGLLQQSSESMATQDDQNLKQALVDNKDEDGTPLNEKANQSGSDLDVPGSGDDDADEEIGEEDEENNPYSLHSEEEDQNNGKQ